MADQLNWEPSRATPELLIARTGRVAAARLNRPEVRNAISVELLLSLTETLESFDQDPTVNVLVLTGGPRWFAAGADIGAMASAGVVEMTKRPQLACWHRLRRLKKPLVAAVNGYAVGGGAELVWLCDLVVAGESALFGQPEINLGLMPGGGATQRLTRSAGKARTMEIVLFGDPMTSDEAQMHGLVNWVVPDELVLASALRTAAKLAEKPPLAVQRAKEAVLASFDLPIEAGLDFERSSFNLLFATDDAQEGLAAFAEKRQPKFKGR